jgi:hypothetical protein
MTEKLGSLGASCFKKNDVEVWYGMAAPELHHTSTDHAVQTRQENKATHLISVDREPHVRVQNDQDLANIRLAVKETSHEW